MHWAEGRPSTTTPLAARERRRFMKLAKRFRLPGIIHITMTMVSWSGLTGHAMIPKITFGEITTALDARFRKSVGAAVHARMQAELNPRSGTLFTRRHSFTMTDLEI